MRNFIKRVTKKGITHLLLEQRDGIDPPKLQSEVQTAKEWEMVGNRVTSIFGIYEN